MKKQKKHYRIEYLYRPGLTMSDQEVDRLNQELRAVAETCFDQLPEYQCLVPGREALSDKVITLARRPDGSLGGFCSSVLLPVEGIGDVFHAGLTCVHINDRGQRLTHRLVYRLLLTYLVKERKLRRFWLTNCACVLSSLGSIALNFDNVHPSPFNNTQPPSRDHLRIAAAIDRHYRKELAIEPDAVFDPNAFVFRDSVKDTVFAKDGNDTRYHHRNRVINDFYRNRLRFSHGDEVLQIGQVSLMTAFGYISRRKKSKKIAAAPPHMHDPALQWADRPLRDNPKEVWSDIMVNAQQDRPEVRP
ncbi:MAG: hypothetical protein AAFS10_00885 [Myxococcota bacterium]